jgi:hypothetical protein
LIVLEFFAWQFSDCFHSETAFRCPRNVCTYPNSDQILRGSEMTRSARSGYC